MRRNPNHLLIAICLDIVCLVFAVAFSSWVRIALPIGRYLPEVTQEIPLLIEALLIYPFVFLLVSLYDPDRSMQEWDEFLALTTACAIAGLALAGLIYFSFREISRLLLLYFYGIHFLLVYGWRIIAHLWNRGAGSAVHRRALLVGDGVLAQQVVTKMGELPGRPVELVGCMANRVAPGISLPGVPCLGDVGQTIQVVQEYQIDDVLIAIDGESPSRLQPIVTSLVETSCNVWLAPDYYSLLVYGGQVRDWGGLSLIGLKAPTLTGYQRLLKRTFDLVIGGVMLVGLLPLLLLVALMIRLDTPGGVMLKQQRVGENRKWFGMYKFRTMLAGGENSAADKVRIDINGQLLHKSPDDPRVTRIGRFLRRTSLDELPQLWNVLKGEMSLVGPRPELPMLVAQYEPWQQKRFSVPQGMTGWWQVNGRSDRPMHLHTEDDLYYIQHYSIWFDVQILLKTIWVVIRGKGAY